jgi:hypothetical protein
MNHPKNANIVADGDTVRVPIYMMDHNPGAAEATAALAEHALLNDGQVRHSPGSRPITDAELDGRVEALRDRKERLAEAWRNPPSAELQSNSDLSSQQSDVDDALAQRDLRLTNAWKGGAA